DAIAYRFRMLSAPYGRPDRMEMDTKAPIQVKFSEFALPVEYLYRVREYIARAVLWRFAPLFGESVPGHLLATHRRSDEFERIRPGQIAKRIQQAEDTPAVFGDWQVWFDLSDPQLA